jgi:hypothetical protein
VEKGSGAVELTRYGRFEGWKLVEKRGVQMALARRRQPPERHLLLGWLKARRCTWNNHQH